MSELGMWPAPTPKTEQAPEPADDLTAPGAPGPLALDAPVLESEPTLAESEPTPAAEQPWSSASEEEWNEHRATSWALAYVIHRIRSTPHPPILTPQQRRHFEKIVEMAAALIAEWQGQERDLAQQLGTRRPVAELATQPLDVSQNGQDDSATDELWTRQMLTPSYQFLLEEDDETETPSNPSEEAGTPDVSDYQI